MKVTKNIRKQFYEVLSKRKVHPVYQPIISLNDGSVYGYEALCRIDLSDCAFNTEQMFGIAEKLKCLWELESICRRMSIKDAMHKPADAKLFVNVDPNVIHDKKFHSGMTAGYLKKYNMEPDDIVFEITERNSVEDAKTFIKSIRHYKKQNYRIAIDDFGSGFAGPNLLCLLEPDIIKIDMEIIRNIDKDRIKRMFVKSLSVFGKNTGTKILAEGIETSEELKVLIDLEIDYGQGYYLGRPVPTFIPAADNIVDEIKNLKKASSNIPGGKLFQFINKHDEDDSVIINDESGNLLERLSCKELKEIFGHMDSGAAQSEEINQ